MLTLKFSCNIMLSFSVKPKKLERTYSIQKEEILRQIYVHQYSKTFINIHNVMIVL